MEPGPYNPDGGNLPEERRIPHMSDRALLEESVELLRKIVDLAEGFVRSVESNPMLSKMGAMFGMRKG